MGQSAQEKSGKNKDRSRPRDRLEQESGFAVRLRGRHCQNPANEPAREKQKYKVKDGTMGWYQRCSKIGKDFNRLRSVS
jgi:hypothetical protein